jgi:AcrR family transcriptional regulator
MQETGTGRERIVLAALKCFERLGIQRTTMEDIAKAAGVSRKTVYRLFENKTSLVAEVAAHETAAVCAAAFARLDLSAPSDALVTAAEIELLKEGWTRASKRAFLEGDIMETLEIVVNDRQRLELMGAYWQPILDHIDARGDLRQDVDRDRLLRWIILVHSMFLTSPGLSSFGSDMRFAGEMLQRFFCPSILRPNI